MRRACHSDRRVGGEKARLSALGGLKQRGSMVMAAEGGGMLKKRH